MVCPSVHTTELTKIYQRSIRQSAYIRIFSVDVSDESVRSLSTKAAVDSTCGFLCFCFELMGGYRRSSNNKNKEPSRVIPCSFLYCTLHLNTLATLYIHNEECHLVTFGSCYYMQRLFYLYWTEIGFGKIHLHSYDESVRLETSGS